MPTRIRRAPIKDHTMAEDNRDHRSSQERQAKDTREKLPWCRQDNNDRSALQLEALGFPRFASTDDRVELDTGPPHAMG